MRLGHVAIRSNAGLTRWHGVAYGAGSVGFHYVPRAADEFWAILCGLAAFCAVLLPPSLDRALYPLAHPLDRADPATPHHRPGRFSSPPPHPHHPPVHPECFPVSSAE